MGGMIAATFLAIFFVPMFFKLITDRHLGETRSTAELREEIAHHHAIALDPVSHPQTAPGPARSGVQKPGVSTPDAGPPGGGSHG